MVGSTCTTCDITADKSGYWVPSLYNELADGRFEAVPFRKINAYYLVDPGRFPDLPDPKAPVPGFEAIFGDPNAREFSKDSATQYKCERIGGKNGNNKDFDEFPPADQECPFLRADVSGPNCWNGEARGTDDSHTLRQSGNLPCPSSHPIRIISQKIESYWDLSNIALPRKLIWSHGDRTGNGYHADFVNGWDQDVLEAAVGLCDIRDGLEAGARDNSNCNLPKFEQSDKSCDTCAKEYQSSLPGGNGRLVPDEDCTGTIDQLCDANNGVSISSIFGGDDSLPRFAPTNPAQSYAPPAPTQRSVPRREAQDVAATKSGKCKNQYKAAENSY
jgi:hypothetical protein